MLAANAVQVLAGAGQGGGSSAAFRLRPRPAGGSQVSGEEGRKNAPWAWGEGPAGNQAQFLVSVSPWQQSGAGLAGACAAGMAVCTVLCMLCHLAMHALQVMVCRPCRAIPCRCPATVLLARHAPAVASTQVEQRGVGGGPASCILAAARLPTTCLPLHASPTIKRRWSSGGWRSTSLTRAAAGRRSCAARAWHITSTPPSSRQVRVWPGCCSGW